MEEKLVIANCKSKNILFPVDLQEGTRPLVLGGRGRVRSCISYVFTKGT